ncbi:fructosamine kinase family protein [Jannaschia sp. R86511]|uniref:fructosamine kinase family protein n=1 Tax=Jannaschia sp. R86511 TaxID=3093853 RepID=UPI0036D25AA3
MSGHGPATREHADADPTGPGRTGPRSTTDRTAADDCGSTAAALQDDQLFVKRRRDAPPGYFAVEAAGLRWLAAADGVDVVQPLRVAEDALVLPRLPEVTPTAQAAEQLGRGLARTHAAGAAQHGTGPDGWQGDGYIGPLVLPLRTGTAWGPWFAEFRLLPYLRSAHDAGVVTEAESATVSRLLDRLVADPGLAGDPEPPARLHGDLWNGNVMWTADGVVLVDPAAHGGHRETDLAMLALFDLPHLPRVLSAYDEAAPLAAGWAERVALHQVHPLLVHAVLFGGGYGSQAAGLAARYV